MGRILKKSKFTEKHKENLLLLVLAATVGFLGSYAANYFFAFFKDQGSEVYHLFGIISIALFFGIIIFFVKWMAR